MTILSVFQSVAPVIGIEVPSAVMASTEREHVELASLANEMAGRIARGHDWQRFSTVATLTGDGSSTAFDLPSDYDRMQDESRVWSSSIEGPLTHIKSLDEWLGLDVHVYDLVINAWIIYGGQMHIRPAMASGVTAKFFYQSNLIVAPGSGDNKVAFTSDTDSYRLDEQLLKLGIIWQWKANKGQAYAEDMANYEQLLSRRAAKDGGSKKLTVGRVRMPADTTIAYPVPIQP